MRYRLRTLMIVLAIGPALYLGSFAWFWATPHRFDLAPASDPQHYIVIFSVNTDRHCAFRSFYWPLISTVPGHRFYPNREEHEVLMFARHHPYGY
jgi:hypothetical protein